MNIIDWIEYGRKLSGLNLMVDESESYENRAFQVVDVEEAFGDIRSLITNVVVRWFIPTYTIMDPGGSPRKIYTAGFMILVKHNRGETDDYINAITKAEDISDQFIDRIKYDSQNDSTLFLGGEDSYEEMSINGVPIKGSGDSNFSGWITTLQIMSPLPEYCNKKDYWKDL